MNNKIVFISDLHLDVRCPQITNTFYYFLDHIARDAEALYILGDLFESYIGDDDRDPFIVQIRHALRRITQLGVPVYIMPGNRDFLMGKRFEYLTGVKCLVDPTIIKHGEKTILLMHGDSLCTEDKSHQRFRKIVHNPFVQWLFLSFPLSFRRKIANQLRQESREYSQRKSFVIMDVNQEAVKSALTQYHADLLIHGHTHRPLLSEQRIVLDAWHEHGQYLELDKEGRAAFFTIPH